MSDRALYTFSLASPSFSATWVKGLRLLQLLLLLVLLLQPVSTFATAANVNGISHDISDEVPLCVWSTSKGTK